MKIQCFTRKLRCTAEVRGAREVQDAAARRSGEDPPRGARDHGRGVQARGAHEQAHEGVQRDDAPEDRAPG